MDRFNRSASVLFDLLFELVEHTERDGQLVHGQLLGLHIPHLHIAHKIGRQSVCKKDDSGSANQPGSEFHTGSP
jgi:hypothetical protein